MSSRSDATTARTQCIASQFEEDGYVRGSKYLLSQRMRTASPSTNASLISCQCCHVRPSNPYLSISWIKSAEVVPSAAPGTSESSCRTSCHGSDCQPASSSTDAQHAGPQRIP